jgi:hypothetical protein
MHDLLFNFFLHVFFFNLGPLPNVHVPWTFDFPLLKVWWYLHINVSHRRSQGICHFIITLLTKESRMTKVHVTYYICWVCTCIDTVWVGLKFTRKLCFRFNFVLPMLYLYIPIISNIVSHMYLVYCNISWVNLYKLFLCKF